MQSGTLSLSAILRPGIIAGLAGAVLIDVYLLVTIVAISHGATLESFFQYVASGAIGPAAYTGGIATALLGVAVHLIVGITWGIGYAYAAARTPQLIVRPLVSGITYGVLVMFAMQLVEVAANIYHIPDASSLINGLIAHIAFFGLPIAYVVARTLKHA